MSKKSDTPVVKYIYIDSDEKSLEGVFDFIFEEILKEEKELDSFKS